MIKLNILPEQLKKNAEYKSFFTKIKRIFIIIIISLSFYSVALISTKIFIDIYKNGLSESSLTKTKQTEDYFKQVKDINNKIDYIDEVQNNIINWSEFFNNFNNKLNDNITISQIDIDKKNLNFSLSGTAATIADLEELEKNLNDIAYLEGFKIPDELFFKEKNIKFDFKSKFINYEFK